VYASNGFKLSYRDIPHDVPQKIKGLLEHRAGSLEVEIKGYRQFSEGDAEGLFKNHEELLHLAPEGLGPFLLMAKNKTGTNKLLSKEPRRALAEYASHVRAL